MNPETVVCLSCRRAGPNYRLANKRAKGVVETWTCLGCGVLCERPATKGQHPKWCAQCRVLAARNKAIKIAPAARLAVYEADSWACWLCLGAVDRDLIGSWSLWRPSLDHVVPRSTGGSDDPSNLRLAHVWCNSVRGAGRYLPEDFRVGV